MYSIYSERIPAVYGTNVRGSFKDRWIFAPVGIPILFVDICYTNLFLYLQEIYTYLPKESIYPFSVR